MRPSSPYAVSKAAQDHLAWTYFRSYGMKIIRTRMFAYINPKRTDLFATAFVRQAVRIEAGLQKELLHGNLDSIRTWRRKRRIITSKINFWKSQPEPK